MRRFLLVAVVAACRSERAAPPAPPPSARAPAHHVAPRPTLPTSAVAWSFAERSGTADAWDAAADAYERELATCTAACQELAYQRVLARKNALVAAHVVSPPGDERLPLPPRAAALVESIDRYVAAEPGDPEVAGLEFLAGTLMARWGQPEAIDRLAVVLREHADDPVAEYAANIMLDALNRGGSYAEMCAWVEPLLADAALLAGKDALRATLEQLREHCIDNAGE